MSLIIHIRNRVVSSIDMPLQVVTIETITHYKKNINPNHAAGPIVVAAVLGKDFTLSRTENYSSERNDTRLV